MEPSARNENRLIRDVADGSPALATSSWVRGDDPAGVGWVEAVEADDGVEVTRPRRQNSATLAQESLHGGVISYGNPFVEDDIIAFTGGTGQFAGLSGSASFHTFFAGARATGTLKGTLSS